MNKVKPTKLQLKTLEIKQANPDMPMGKAMVEAGYSEVTSQRPKQNLVDSRGFETAVEQFRVKLTDLGIDSNFMAKKYKEWVTAKKPFSSHTEPDKMIPDYQTQIKAGEMIREDLGIKTKESGMAIQINNILNEKKEKYGI